MREGKRDKGREWEREKGQWGRKPVRKWEHWSTRGCRGGKKKETAARYSEPLLEMINQLEWAELTSKGLVCTFSSCPNNPLQTHAHTDKSCTSSVPLNYSYGNLKISDLFQPVAHSIFCSSSKLKNSPVHVDFSCFKIKACQLPNCLLYSGGRNV